MDSEIFKDLRDWFAISDKTGQVFLNHEPSHEHTRVVEL